MYGQRTGCAIDCCLETTAGLVMTDVQWMIAAAVGFFAWQKWRESHATAPAPVPPPPPPTGGGPSSIQAPKYPFIQSATGETVMITMASAWKVNKIGTGLHFSPATPEVALLYQ